MSIVIMYVILICMFLSTLVEQRTEQVPIELDISALEEYVIIIIIEYKLDYIYLSQNCNFPDQHRGEKEVG